ncbi:MULTISPECIES: hypothetical protein [unclassified Nocardia]|uniref:hypothetical protein n=1 Tax=unclassified Nocardia TaxID=2637762 RepID=UPI0024A90868|nr:MULTISPECIES: hypothetical protein [unclassified Nocardia]
MTPDEAHMLADIHRELTQRYSSRSARRHTDEPIDTLAGFVLNADAHAHELSQDIPAKLDQLQRTLDELPARIAAAVQSAQSMQKTL